jgi:uncharacterized protein (DUF433 family)
MDRETSKSDTLTISLEGMLADSYAKNQQPMIADSNSKILGIILDNTSRTPTTISAEPNFRKVIMQIINELGEEHPEIAVDPDMVGGMPHIKGVRLSVGTVLAKLYYYGSIEKVKEVYGDDISENQIKEAIAYAQDFLEKTYAQSKSS